jgi:hypothetical protein
MRPTPLLSSHVLYSGGTKISKLAPRIFSFVSISFPEHLDALSAPYKILFRTLVFLCSLDLMYQIFAFSYFLNSE